MNFIPKEYFCPSAKAVIQQATTIMAKRMISRKLLNITPPPFVFGKWIIKKIFTTMSGRPLGLSLNKKTNYPGNVHYITMDIYILF